MRRRERYKHLLNNLSNFILLAIQAAMFTYMWYNIYIPTFKNYTLQRGNWAVIGIYVLFIYFFTYFFGGYRIGYLRTSDICLSQILGVLLANFVAYFEICLAARRYVQVWPLLVLALLETAVIIPMVFLVRYVYIRLYPPRSMIVVYGNYPPDLLIEKINTRKDKYNICASVSYRIGYQKLYPMMKEYNSVLLCDLPADARNQIVKYCYQESIRAYITPKISDILISSADSIHLFDTPLLLMRSQGLTIDQRFFKRVQDLVISICGIILFSPLMLLIAAVIKLYDRGPVLYRQERYTRDEEVFEILKFRSMAVHNDNGSVQITKQKDKRITPIGKVLRRTHLDELPQLFNILKGDMSVVGPRAEWIKTTDKYIKIVPEFALRLKVKAGLTGYAQVYGKYNTTPYDKIKLDITYIENYSFWLDMKLLLMTVKVLFKKENTEGIGKDQETAIREVGQGGRKS